MTNGEVDLVIVPKIGRVMFFGRTGGANVLWVNPDIRTSSIAKPGEWANYGGDKCWPAPQSDWSWPPDPDLDGKPHKARVIGGDTIELTSPTSRTTGLRIVRSFTMHPLGTEVSIVNRLQNRSKRTHRAGLWQIAQTANPDTAYMPASGFRPYGTDPIDPAFVTREGSEMTIQRDPKANRKFGAKGATGMLRWKKGPTEFTMRHRLERGEYPDEDRAQQLFTSQDPVAYVELELTAPLEDLKPGGESRLDVLWKVTETGITRD